MRTFHVWAAGLDQPAGQISSLEQILSPDEQDRAQKFKFENSRERFIVGRSLLRTILGSYLQVNPTQLRFIYSPRGKPSLENIFGHGALHFNVAHSQNLILIAVTRACPLGVDVEWANPIKDFEDIADRFFSKNETAKLKAAPADQRMAAFYSLWTRKEAYLKATGEGLSDALGEVEFTFLPRRTPAPARNFKQRRSRSALDRIRSKTRP